MFLPLSVEFLGEYQLPQADYQGTRVGGLSAITYDRANNRFYLLSDDRSQKAPARFYRASLQINGEKIEKVNLEAVTFLKDGPVPDEVAKCDRLRDYYPILPDQPD